MLTLDADAAAILRVHGPQVSWEIDLEVPPRGSAEATWRLDLVDPSVPFVAATAPWTASAAAERAGTSAAEDPERRAVARLLRRSLADLDALRLQRPDEPAHTFLAAGAPWFFTLFGRDSLIVASLLLPVDTSVAAGTLRTLAAAQGSRVDPGTAEQPGKILHEVRAAEMFERADGGTKGAAGGAGADGGVRADGGAGADGGVLSAEGGGVGPCRAVPRRGDGASPMQGRDAGDASCVYLQLASPASRHRAPQMVAGRW